MMMRGKIKRLLLHSGKAFWGVSFGILSMPCVCPVFHNVKVVVFALNFQMRCVSV